MAYQSEDIDRIDEFLQDLLSDLARKHFIFKMNRDEHLKSQYQFLFGLKSALRKTHLNEKLAYLQSLELSGNKKNSIFFQRFTRTKNRLAWWPDSS